MQMTRKTLGAGTLFAGALILIVSAKFSYEGFAGTFDTIPGAGWIGVGFAALAFVTASAVRIFGDDSDTAMRNLALGLLALAFAGDVSGNWQAMTLQTVTASQADLDRSSAYEEASQSLPRVRGEIEALTGQLSLIGGGDIVAAQRLLKTAGFYQGKLDGDAGGKTEAAMLAFGRDARPRLDALKAREAGLAETLAGGAPVNKGDHRAALNMLFAVLLTISTSLASIIGTRLLIGAAELDMIDASEEAATASAQIVDLLGKAA